MSIIYDTSVISLFIQVVTQIFDIYVLSIEFSPSLSFIKHLLWIEFFVQFIESIFYFWLVLNFSNIENITKYRYFDWVITTPSMLFTYCMYLYSIHHKNNTHTFYSTAEANLYTLLPIFILNTIMLFFGYLAEIGILRPLTSAILGFIPFCMFFYLIYETYAKYTSIGRITFYYFITIWSLYGFSSILKYKYKNIAYNILDLFSKNFFGIFLASVLLYNKNTTISPF